MDIRCEYKMQIITKNLILRPWREEDADCLYYYARNPKIGPMAGWFPHLSVEYSLYIIKTLFQKKETYAITLRENNKPIGCVNLLVYPDGNYYWGEDNAELGYWIGEPYWGKGFAVEASQELIKRAFNNLDIKQIFALTRKENSQSQSVLKKLGFNFLKEIQNIDYKNNIYKEIVMYLKK